MDKLRRPRAVPSVLKSLCLVLALTGSLRAQVDFRIEAVRNSSDRVERFLTPGESLWWIYVYIDNTKVTNATHWAGVSLDVPDSLEFDWTQRFSNDGLYHNLPDGLADFLDGYVANGYYTSIIVAMFSVHRFCFTDQGVPAGPKGKQGVLGVLGVRCRDSDFRGLAKIGFSDAFARDTNNVLQPTRTSEVTIRISDSAENDYNYQVQPFVIRDTDWGGAQRVFINPFAVTPSGGGFGRLAIEYSDSLMPGQWRQLTVSERDPIPGSVPPMYPAIDFLDKTATNSPHRFYRARAVAP